MAITIDTAFIEEYEDNVRHLAQQMETRLRPKVYEVSSGGKAYNFERLASTEVVERTAAMGTGGRRVATSESYQDDTWSRRIATPKTYFHTMTVEHEDQVQMLVDPKSNYAYNQAMAFNRQYDTTIIKALGGDALDENGAVVFDTANYEVGDGTAPISFDMVTEDQEKDMADEIMPYMAKCMGVGPKQVRKLMQLTEQTSSDYVQAQALQRYGIVPNWLGYTWIVSNLLELGTSGAGTLNCLSFTMKGLGLAVNQDTFTRIGEDPSMSYMWQVFSQFTLGAVRIEDEHVHRLYVLDDI